MWDMLKEKVKTAGSAATSLVDGCLDRQVGFVTSMMTGSVAAARQLRESRSLHDIMTLQTSYMTDMQAKMMALGNANFAALKEFGSTTLGLFREPARKSDEAKAPAKKS
jgi:hypothetical protein